MAKAVIFTDDEEDEVIVGNGKSKSPTPFQPQLFLELEDKTEEALKAFTELEKCHYANKGLGNSNQDEQMTCDCHEEYNGKKNIACGPQSDCINRLTSVECINGDCTCGDDCQNQRFQKRQYVPVSVIQTEKKGYGLRANEDIPSDSFIYEYIGDVIDETTFRDRMVKYDQKGFKHFYFMMLQKNEFIDATTRGCLARFCNHSCRPNAFVDKWVVGKKLKMGIFSKRKILKGEEITFDYNVDRYGAQAQPCYCGESNCIGFMGGKTQTDSASLLPQIVAEALGVNPSEEKAWLKMMKLNGRKIKKEEDSNINEEFIASLTMRPLESDEVSKVMSALLRSQEVIICRKLIERIWLTSDSQIHTRIIRMHGYEIFSTLIRDNWENSEEETLTTHILEILSQWPKITKNKISSSKIEHVLKEVVKGTDNSQIESLASNLLDAWSSLEMAYRIPKRSEKQVKATSAEPEVKVETLPASRIYDDAPLPGTWEWAIAPDTNKVYFFNRLTGLTQWAKPVDEKDSSANGGRSETPLDLQDKGFSLKRDYEDDEDEDSHLKSTTLQIPTKPANLDKEEKLQREKLRLQREKEQSEKLRELRELEYLRKEEEAKKKQEGLNSIILKAQKDAETKKLAEQRLKEQEEELRRLKQQRLLHKASKSSQSKSSSNENSKEKKCKKLFAGVVPNMIKKFESEIGHDNIKKCAKDIVNILTEKELKRHVDAELPNEFSDEKKSKIKHFSRSYMDKFLIKYREKESRKRKAEPNGNNTEDVKKLKA